MVVWVLIGVATLAGVSLAVGLAIAAVLRRIAWQTTQLLEHEAWTSAPLRELKLGAPLSSARYEDSNPLGGLRAF